MQKKEVVEIKKNIEIVAPSSGGISSEMLDEIEDKCKEFNLGCHIKSGLLKEDMFNANSLDYKLKHFKSSLNDSDIDAIWALRGGYSSAKMIPYINKYPKPEQEKMYIGYSDSTPLLLFLHQKWGWKPIHGMVAKEILREKSQDSTPSDNFKPLREIILGERHELRYESELKPYNKAASSLSGESRSIEAVVTGGNMSLIISSIGTNWEIEARGKILIMEEVSERAYKVDRMFVHMIQAGILDDVKAIIIGDMLHHQSELDGNYEDLDKVIRNFAATMQKSQIPVYKTKIFGHGILNYPFVLGSMGRIAFDSNSSKADLSMQF